MVRHRFVGRPNGREQQCTASPFANRPQSSWVCKRSPSCNGYSNTQRSLPPLLSNMPPTTPSNPGATAALQTKVGATCAVSAGRTRALDNRPMLTNLVFVQCSKRASSRPPPVGYPALSTGLHRSLPQLLCCQQQQPPLIYPKLHTVCLISLSWRSCLSSLLGICQPISAVATACCLSTTLSGASSSSSRPRSGTKGSAAFPWAKGWLAVWPAAVACWLQAQRLLR